MSSLPQHIGYKKAYDGSIITLEILGVNNESRAGVVDAQHALFRCSQAKVLAIEHPVEGKIKNTECENDDETVYEVGCIVNSPKVNETSPRSVHAKQIGEDVGGDFGSKLDVVFGEGLHYYLSREAAEGHRNFGTHLHPGVKPKTEEKTWHANGRPWRVNHFDGDCFHMEWADNGQLISKYRYKYGKNCGFFGLSEKWHDDGKPKERIEYSTKSRKHGFSVTYHGNGKLRSQDHYVKGKLRGWGLFHENGNMRELCYLKNQETGVSALPTTLVSLYATWYKDGKPEKLFHYLIPSDKLLPELRFDENLGVRMGDHLHGECFTWFPNGVRESLETFHEGKLHGKCQTWYSNGKMRSSVDYKNGLKNGEAITWPSDNSVGFTQTCYKGFYLQGKRVSKARHLMRKFAPLLQLGF